MPPTPGSNAPRQVPSAGLQGAIPSPCPALPICCASMLHLPTEPSPLPPCRLPPPYLSPKSMHLLYNSQSVRHLRCLPMTTRMPPPPCPSLLLLTASPSHTVELRPRPAATWQIVCRPAALPVQSQHLHNPLFSCRPCRQRSGARRGAGPRDSPHIRTGAGAGAGAAAPAPAPPAPAAPAWHCWLGRGCWSGSPGRAGGPPSYPWAGGSAWAASPASATS
jgi:hypothetical protein